MEGELFEFHPRYQGTEESVLNTRSHLCEQDIIVVFLSRKIEFTTANQSASRKVGVIFKGFKSYYLQRDLRITEISADNELKPFEELIACQEALKSTRPVQISTSLRFHGKLEW